MEPLFLIQGRKNIGSKIMFNNTVFKAIFVSAFIVLSSCDPADRDTHELQQNVLKLFGPLPDHFFQNGVTPSQKKIELGRRLFFEKSISIDGRISCSTCHPPENHGADNLPVSIGNNSKPNPRNAPTVLNAALQFAQHWRGDRTDVEDQAIRALTGGASFGAPNGEFVEDHLKQSELYKKEFAEAYPDDSNPVSTKNFADAVGAYERTLVSPSRFDDFLKGDLRALSGKEKSGLSLFMEKGCAGCHSGNLVGGKGFQKFGVNKSYDSVLYKNSSEPPEKVDHGRMDVTGKEEDRDVFKIPSLRNVEKTAPYFHDGSVESLDTAVAIMGELQLGMKLSGEEREKIVSFLQSLTGKIPENFSKPE